MFEFKLPDIGEGLAEAEILEWAVKPGDAVREGDIVAVASTDKVNVELSSPCDGTIEELCAEIGDVIDVGTVFVRIDNGRGSASAGQTAPETSGAEASGAEASSEINTTKAETAAIKRPGKVRASPAVKRFAAEKGVDLGEVIGSGPGGMVMKEDVVRHLDGTSGPEQPATHIERLSGARLSAAQNLARSAHTTATTTISFDLRVDRLAQAIKDSGAVKSSEFKLTPLAIIALSVAAALKLHPRFNANIDEGSRALIIGDAINLGIAVAAKDGLLVPVIDGFGQKGVREAIAAISDISERGRTGALSLSELRNSTFTLSSTGGIERVMATSTAPVLNYPNVAMLWVSRFTDRPWVDGGELVVAKVMSCSLAFDHRYLHGADGFAFINDFEKIIQNPGSILDGGLADD